MLVVIILSFLFLWIGDAGGAEKIVFASDSTGNYEIYIMNPDGSELTRVTDNSAADVEPAFSSDGRWIAFSSNRDGDYEIYKICFDSSEVTGAMPFQITHNGVDDREPDWSPTSWDSLNSRSVCYTKGDEIYFKNANGTGSEFPVTSNTHNSRPTWDIDGKHILYSHGQWVSSLGCWVYNLHAMKLKYGPGASITKYFSNHENVRNSAVSSTGMIAYILVETSGSPSYEVWDLSPIPVNITNWLRPMSDIGYSPTGDTLLFCAEQATSPWDYEIYKKKSDGTGTTWRVTNNSHNDMGFDYADCSPDYKIVDIFHPPYRIVQDDRVDVSFSIFGKGYIWNTLKIYWDWESFSPPNPGIKLDTIMHRVTFVPESANVLCIPFPFDTLWLKAEIQADTGSGIILIDSTWWYMYNPAPSMLDSAIRASKEYCKKMFNLYITAEQGRARLQIASSVIDCATLFVQPLATGAGVSDFALSGVEYVVSPNVGKVTGFPMGVNSILFDNLDNALSIASNHCLTQAQALHSDPPDSEYTFLPYWVGDMDTAHYPQTDDSLGVYFYLAERRMSLNAELMRLLTSSMEKYQGAVQDENQFYIFMQAKGMQHIAEQIAQNCALLDTTFGWIVDSLRGSEIDRYLDVKYIDSTKSRISTYGISNEERIGLLEAGLTNAQIAELMDTLLAINTNVLHNCWLSDIYDSIQTNFADGVPVFTRLSTDIQGLLDSLVANEITSDSFPVAAIGGPYCCVEGDIVSLSGASSTDPNGLSLSYYWDLDADGSFDDAFTATPDYPSSEQGLYMIGLKVENTANFSGYDYSYVIVANSDSMPIITHSEPESSFIVTDIDTMINFVISAYDPEGAKSLTYQWKKDTLVVSSDSFYNYVITAGDTGLHHIKVLISDGVPQSFDTELDWWIRVGQVVSVQDFVSPVAFKITGYYPNPFTAGVRVKCSGISKNQKISLKIYDLSGRLVKTLIPYPSSLIPVVNPLSLTTVVEWDGRDSEGELCPNGLYFCHLKVGNYEETKKVVLIR